MKCGECAIKDIVRSLVFSCSVIYEDACRAGWPIQQAEWMRTKAFNELWPAAWKRIQDEMRPRWWFWKKVVR
jgi:hypothetical protein